MLPKLKREAFRSEKSLLNERQITHLIGAQPALEHMTFSDVFGLCTGNVRKICKLQEKKGQIKKESQNPLRPPLPKKSYSKRSRRTAY